MQQQPSAQGIASLYMGNPGALQQRVQKEQQAKPGLPPDLGKLMALNIVTNEQDAAKRQQALNAVNKAMGPTGQMPTVAQSLEEQAKQKVQAQMLQQQRQQMAMQQMAKQGGIAAGIPENVAQPESQPQGIDEAPVDMEFCGGGIVAFADGDSVDYETPYDRMNRENRERAEARRRTRAEEEAALQAGEDLVAADGEYYAKPLPAGARAGSPLLQQFAAWAGRNVERDPETGEVVRKTDMQGLPQASYSNEGRRAAPPPAGVGPSAAATAPGARGVQAGAPGARSAGIVGGRPQDPLEAAKAAVLKQAMEQMARTPDAAFAEGAERSKKYVGLEDLLKDRRDRIAGREAEFAKAKAERTPAFIEGLAGLAGAPIRGGLGMMLGQAGNVAGKARAGYAEEDLKFADTIDKLKDEVLKAQIEGRYKDAAAGEAAIRDLTANKRQAEQSVTSMANTAEQAATRREATAARLAASGGADKQQLAELKALQTNLQNQLKTEFNKEQRMAINAQLAKVNAAIAQMAGLDTMGAAPGAASPGGTRPPLSSFQR